MSCNCHSYNWEIGERPEVALTHPRDMELGRTDPSRPIMVDACIAHVVEALWAAGIETLGSCCGHGREDTPLPTIILTQHIDPAPARAVIASVEPDRPFTLLQWQLVDVSAVS